MLSRQYPGKHLPVIVNNLAVHKHQKIMEYIKNYNELWAKHQVDLHRETAGGFNIYQF